MDKSIGDLKTGVNAAVEQRGELAPGSKLGRYEILRLLGRGGMGQVYLARHELQKTLHAVKILPSDFSARTGFVERFRTELQTMARMQHPNIVHVTHSDVDDGRYYLVMDFVGADGTEEPCDLEEALAVQKRLPSEVVRRLALQICEGLACAHGQGVVHRDLKPANILLTSRDLTRAEARICDFGLARVIGEDQVRTLVSESIQRSMSMGDQDTFVEKRRSERSSTGAVLGTYGYMSPEQEEGRPADERSDFYALGVMMYRMVTGQRLRGLAKPASQVVPGLNTAWDAVINKCLESDPAGRFQSAQELDGALGALGAGGKGAGASAGKRWLALALGAAAVAAAAALWLRASGAAPAPKPPPDIGVSNGIALVAAVLPPPLVTNGPSVATVSEDDVRDRYAAAKRRYDKAMKYDDGQGFKVRKEKLEEAWIKAEDCEKDKDWPAALKGYDSVTARAAELDKLEEDRAVAVARRAESDQACKLAEAVRAAEEASELFGKGGPDASRAQQLFEAAKFGEAAAAWQASASAYALAQKRAKALQDWRQAGLALEGAAKKADAAMMNKYGGAKWAEALRLQGVGRAAEKDPEKGEQEYKRALAVLSEAVVEAQETKRRAEIDDALVPARLAKANGEWDECLKKAKVVLALDASHAEARSLKDEAEKNSAPTLEVIAEADGRSVEAQVSNGKESHPTPFIFTMRRGSNYTYTVSYKPANSVVRFKTAQLSVTADWAGLRSERVKLAAAEGPQEGEEWVSPTAGMAFVWVPALKIWMGKFEVTNEEYRKMTPAHVCKDFKTFSLNGDRMPVVSVNFNDARAYSAWLSERDKPQLGGFRYRLPTGKEWTAAARCGDDREYPWGNYWPPKSGQAGNYHGQEGAGSWGKVEGYDDGFPAVCEVEKSWKNSWGLYGLGGNVWECCATGVDGLSFDAWLGGSWLMSSPTSLRCDGRSVLDENGQSGNYSSGFRLVLAR